MALHYTKTLIVTDHCAKNYIPEFGPVFLWTILGNALHWTTVDCSALGRSDILLVQRYRGLMGILLRSFSFFESSFSMVRSPFSMVKYCLKSALVWSISPDFSFFSKFNAEAEPRGKQTLGGVTGSFWRSAPGRLWDYKSYSP